VYETDKTGNDPNASFGVVYANVLFCCKGGIMKVTTVKMIFKGSKTVNEVYELYIRELKDVILMLDPKDLEALTHKRQELKELLAIIQNKITVGQGHKLISVDEI
jgi:hypothetical protein